MYNCVGAIFFTFFQTFFSETNNVKINPLIIFNVFTLLLLFLLY